MPGCGNLMCACRKGAGQLFVFRTLLSFLMGRQPLCYFIQVDADRARLLLLARPLIRLSSLPSLTMWQFLLPNDSRDAHAAFSVGGNKGGRRCHRSFAARRHNRKNPRVGGIPSSHHRVLGECGPSLLRVAGGRRVFLGEFACVSEHKKMRRCPAVDAPALDQIAVFVSEVV